MRPSQISKIHRATGDALDDSIGGLEAENTKLKEIIKELEEALMPLPILSSPLAMIGPTTPAAKLKGSSSLLTSVKGYVEKNIKKIIELGKKLPLNKFFNLMKKTNFLLETKKKYTIYIEK